MGTEADHVVLKGRFNALSRRCEAERKYAKRVLEHGADYNSSSEDESDSEKTSKEPTEREKERRMTLGEYEKKYGIVDGNIEKNDGNSDLPLSLQGDQLAKATYEKELKKMGNVPYDANEVKNKLEEFSKEFNEVDKEWDKENPQSPSRNNNNPNFEGDVLFNSLFQQFIADKQKEIKAALYGAYDSEDDVDSNTGDSEDEDGW